MVLIYKKTLSIKHAGSSNDKIINSINLDAEKIGDFCSYIHGVWRLPVQVLLGSIILYWNLGGAPSMAASFATVLVMVCNTPLAKMQKKEIKVTSETSKSMRVLKLHTWQSTFFI